MEPIDERYVAPRAACSLVRVGKRSTMCIVGIVSIHEDEAARLPGGTARSAVNPNEYVVELEMFHQLHCLVSKSRNR